VVVEGGALGAGRIAEGEAPAGVHGQALSLGGSWAHYSGDEAEDESNGGTNHAVARSRKEEWDYVRATDAHAARTMRGNAR